MSTLPANHPMRKSRRPAPARVRAERFIDRRPNAGCWEWTGYVHKNGYGQFYYNGNRNGFAHRFMYEYHVGPIPDGLVIDHLCRNRACCNPEHLEAVTQRENLLRGEVVTTINLAKTHCISGHEFTLENTYQRPDRPGRMCRVCRYEANRRSQSKKVA